MDVQLADVAAWVGQFLWPFERVGAAFMVAPLFSAAMVPARIRLGMAFLTVVAVWPLLPAVPAVSPFGAAALTITFQQLAIGAAMGFILRLMFEAISVGGQVVATTMGLGFASTVDPEHGVRVPVVSQYFTILTALIFLGLNGHLIFIKVIAGSFNTLPIGSGGLTGQGFHAVAAFGTHMFMGAVLVALPALIALLVVNLSFGVMSRAAPTLNLFAVGFPITMLLGFIVIWMSLRNLLPNISLLSNQAFGLLNRLLTAGL